MTTDPRPQASAQDSDTATTGVGEEEAAGGPPNEGAPGHGGRERSATPTGEPDAERPNEGAPGHQPD